MCLQLIRYATHVLTSKSRHPSPISWHSAAQNLYLAGDNVDSKVTATEFVYMFTLICMTSCTYCSPRLWSAYMVTRVTSASNRCCPRETLRKTFRTGVGDSESTALEAHKFSVRWWTHCLISLLPGNEEITGNSLPIAAWGTCSRFWIWTRNSDNAPLWSSVRQRVCRYAKITSLEASRCEARVLWEF